MASFCVDMLADLENVSAAARYAAAATDVGAADAQKAARVAALRAGEPTAARPKPPSACSATSASPRSTTRSCTTAGPGPPSGCPAARRPTGTLFAAQLGPNQGSVLSRISVGFPVIVQSLYVTIAKGDVRSIHWLRAVAVLAIVISGLLLGGGAPASAGGGATIGPVQINPVGHPHLCWQATGNGAPILLEACDPALSPSSGR